MPAADSIDSIDKLTAAAAEHGLLLRGCFAVGAGDEVPDVAGAPAAQLMLFGNAGSAMWTVFNLSDEYRDGRPDPLNRWSRRIGEALAKRAGARALFPFGTPHRPFLQWGKRAEALQNSQLGMLIHPKFGLWHAYRFALAFAAGGLAAGERLDAPVTVVDGDICARCTAKPCLRACPVNAFSAGGYDVSACVAHLESNPDGRCMTRGCQARMACPQGAAYRYRPAHAGFHMRAFVAALTGGEFAAESRATTSGEAPPA